MTDQQYRERILEVERYCEKLGFLDDKDCPIGDFFAHAEVVMRFLTETVENAYYEVDPPAFPGNHLDADCLRHLRYFEQRWE